MKCRLLQLLLCLLVPCNGVRLAHSPAGKASTSGCVVQGSPDGCAQSKCHYGTLPGLWRPVGPPGTTYSLMSDTCSLQNLLAPFIEAAGEENAERAAEEASVDDQQADDGADDGDSGESEEEGRAEESSEDQGSESADSASGAGSADQGDETSGSSDSADRSDAAESSDSEGVGDWEDQESGDWSESDSSQGSEGQDGYDSRRRRKLQEPSGQQPVGILIFGDSNDRELVNHVCALANRTTTKFITEIDGDRETCEKKNAGWPYNGINNCNTCEIPGLRMTKEAIWGVAAEGPYYENRMGTATKRVYAGLQLFAKEWGRAPDMIVVASALWDIARWSYHKPEWTQPKHLPDEALDAWIKDASALMDYIREHTEDYNPLLVFRTTAFPKTQEGDADMRHLQADLGTHAHLAQLNAAARHLAAKHGFELVDVERMLSMLSVDEYLMDGHHTHSSANLEVVNVYLNLLRAHRCKADYQAIAIEGS
ncbi:hypothetical protein WJX72_003827 [[Myrmecia] bisecta]|uniref:SGNH hydrolase-type esterase domain-containing protein n=1 Tax=[Myrmecia] bisecta TaxID=41462 RepID=A0AAW1Q0R5_9CHLO